MEEKTWRVKVYQLNEQDDWDDKGTGKVSCLEPAVFSFFLKKLSRIFKSFKKIN